MGKAREIVEHLDRLGRLTRAVQFAECLNPAQWEALRYLAQANRYSRTPGALACFLGATKGTVSQTLSALEDKGLVTRIRSTVDRRSVEIVVTEAGMMLCERDPLSVLKSAVARMGDGALERISGMLKTLLRDIEARHQTPHFGVCRRCQKLVPLDSAAGASQPYRCGMTEDLVCDDEAGKLCVSFAPDESDRQTDG